ncbi:MAG TPA: Glu/Leu/Phe/Val dehydrogenase dimerization domain-containing protein, partial [Gemmatimonadales bacterium]|nr:Glu/Leu/Phe/Val dehydrogenase dimerization domain-containing protein [Gemmatimonadales bacterium]
MDIFGSMRTFGHEQLLLSHDPSCGYFGIIAIHDTTLGPALGGTRFWQYASTEEAVTDALRLARGMTYKSAVAGINLG